MEKNILLIDDDRDELGIFVEAVIETKTNFNCLYADSAESGLTLIRQLEIPFVFIDYNMPQVNGLQLLSIIKHEPKARNSKIFVYTANISDEIIKMAEMLGAAGCVEKPGTVNRLSHELKAIFAGELMPRFSLLMANPGKSKGDYLYHITNPG